MRKYSNMTDSWLTYSSWAVSFSCWTVITGDVIVTTMVNVKKNVTAVSWIVITGSWTDFWQPDCN